MTGIVSADVRVSSQVDGLLIVPERREDMFSVIGELRKSLPGVRLRREPASVFVEAWDSDKLLSVGVGITLRWGNDAVIFAENRRDVRGCYASIRQKVEDIRAGGRTVAETWLQDVAGLDPLDDHQWVNVASMTLPGGFGIAVYDEQGSGKTVTTAFAHHVLFERGEARLMLVVAPKNMLSEWPKDIDHFFGNRYRVGIVAGSREEKRRAIESRAHILITNFEAAVTMELELTYMLKRYGKQAILVVDESFYAKNPDAKRTRALKRLREHCGRAYVLCGTPAPNSPQDLIEQFNLVDFGLTFSGIQVPDDKELALKVIQESVTQRGLFVRHLKADVLPSLPPKQFSRVLVPLAPQQERAYRAALNNLIVDLNSTDDRAFQRKLTSFLARRIALLQICSNPSTVVDGYTETPAKLIALDGILEELINVRREKVVLWSFFTASIDAIMRRYRGFNPVRLDGTVSEISSRREAVGRFQDDPDTMVFVGNPAAAGAGITLHRARYAVYESMSNQAAHYLQSLDRIHRRGQTRDVQYLVLLCDRTLEIREYERLVEKERAAQHLLGDQVTTPITRETMLREALDARAFLEAT